MLFSQTVGKLMQGRGVIQRLSVIQTRASSRRSDACKCGVAQLLYNQDFVRHYFWMHYSRTPFILKAQLFCCYGRFSVRIVQLFSLIQACQNCPIDFNLCMVIPVTVWYDYKAQHLYNRSQKFRTSKVKYCKRSTSPVVVTDFVLPNSLALRLCNLLKLLFKTFIVRFFYIIKPISILLCNLLKFSFKI